MINITIKDYNGKEYSGKWNEKTYHSKIENREDLYRIYIDNEIIHVTPDELIKAVDVNKKQLEIDMAHRRVSNYCLNNIEKFEMLKELLSDYDFCNFMSNGDGTKQRLKFKVNNEIIFVNSLKELYSLCFNNQN